MAGAIGNLVVNSMGALDASEWSKVRGFNYQPSFGDTSQAIWLDSYSADTVKTEVVNITRTFPCVNTLRIWLSHDPFIKEPDRAIENLARTIEIFRSQKIRVIPVLFDNWHRIPDFGGINPEMINYWLHGYGKDGKATNYIFRRYLEPIFKRFGNDQVYISLGYLQ